MYYHSSLFTVYTSFPGILIPFYRSLYIRLDFFFLLVVQREDNVATVSLFPPRNGLVVLRFSVSVLLG